MKLEGEIWVKIGAEEIKLRPTLRHALRLEAKEGGLASLARHLGDGSLSATLEVLSDHSDCVSPSAGLLALDDLREPLLQFVLQCAGIDPDQPPSGDHAGKAQSISDHLHQLYRIATGWLGWAPQVALDSTPGEILLAYEGRLEMLKALFGSSEDKTEQATKAKAAFTDKNVRALFGAIGTKKVRQ